jgi:hypothetical protein
VIITKTEEKQEFKKKTVINKGHAMAIRDLTMKNGESSEQHHLRAKGKKPETIIIF